MAEDDIKPYDLPTYKDFSNPDIIAEMMKQEFTADLSKVPFENKIKFDYSLKSRDENTKELESTEYDLLIIGGGASGCGVVLDAASRGLKCAVIDKYDFASGTSSRSTKMAHGGIRYFE